jgi:signal peptidase II
MSEPNKRDWRGLLLGISAMIIALDRVTKMWVGKHVIEGDGIVVIPRIFRITHVLNAGAAFSLFNNAPEERTRWLLTAVSLIAALIVLVAILRIGRRFSATALALALILGGALGNAWDRIQYKMVTDFLEVYIVHYHWPDFNVADSAIVCGGILLFLGAFLDPGPEVIVEPTKAERLEA